MFENRVFQNRVFENRVFENRLFENMVFENMVIGRIYGPRRDEVTGEWRRLHNEELNDLYCSPNIVRVIKSRRISWTCGAYG